MRLSHIDVLVGDFVLKAGKEEMPAYYKLYIYRLQCGGVDLKIYLCKFRPCGCVSIVLHATCRQWSCKTMLLWARDSSLARHGKCRQPGCTTLFALPAHSFLTKQKKIHKEGTGRQAFVGRIVNNEIQYQRTALYLLILKSIDVPSWRRWWLA